MPSVPSSFKRVVCHTLSSDFRKATSIVQESFSALEKGLKPNQVIVRNVWAGVNASDINFTAGRYIPGATPPLYPGFEAIGEVVKVGSSVDSFEEGTAVALTGYGCFTEYQVVPAKAAIPVPAVDPSFLPLFVSGLTASIALDRVGQMGTNETVLVTAAAGATGQFAVQLAKLAGNHVIGTCSSDVKAEHLKSIGCDRVINYKKQDLRTELKKHYPKGVDLVYESVGGDFFNTCVDSLAVGGRLIVIGFISGYQDQSGWVKGGEDESKTREVKPLPVKLLAKSASVRGFFLNDFPEEFMPHMQKLGGLVASGKMQSGIDKVAMKRFAGLEQVADAIDYMYEGKNMGKVVLRIDQATAASKL